MSVTLTILGAPVTKKNSQRIVRAGKRTALLPSKQHEEWFKGALPQASVLRWGLIPEFRLPITIPVNVRALFYRKRAVGDLNNFIAALGDLLERAGIVANDRFIEGWDGSRLAKDAKHPRIEFTITKLE